MKHPPSGRVLTAVGSRPVPRACSAWTRLHGGLGQEPAPLAPALTADRACSARRPFDRITLTDGTVLIVDPVSPRPLPALDPAKTKKPRRPASRGARCEIPMEGNIGLPGEPSKFKTPEQEKAEEEQDDGRPAAVKSTCSRKPRSATSR